MHIYLYLFRILAWLSMILFSYFIDKTVLLLVHHWELYVSCFSYINVGGSSYLMTPLEHALACNMSSLSASQPATTTKRGIVDKWDEWHTCRRSQLRLIGNRKYAYGCFLYFAKTLVQWQVVPDTVLPAGGRVLVVREVVYDPPVDVFDRQRFDRWVLNGHEDQTRKRVRRLGFRVHL